MMDRPQGADRRWGRGHGLPTASHVAPTGLLLPPKPRPAGAMRWGGSFLHVASDLPTESDFPT
jgi:hypothetical protein